MQDAAAGHIFYRLNMINRSLIRLPDSNPPITQEISTLSYADARSMAIEDEWTDGDSVVSEAVSNTQRPSDEHNSIEEAESERKRDYQASAKLANDKLNLKTGVIYYKDARGHTRLRSFSSLLTWNLRPHFTRPNIIIREHENLPRFFSFVENWSRSKEWKGSTDVSQRGAVDKLLEQPQVKRALESYFALLDNSAKLESEYASTLVAFETTVAYAAKWDIFTDSADKRTICGGVVAFAVPAGSRVLPAIAGTSDGVISNADGTRKIARELKTPKEAKESLHSGCFLVETLVTHLGHNSIATAAIAGDRVALYWTERGQDGIAEIHKYGVRDHLDKLNRRTFAHFIAYQLALVADPVKELPSLLHEPLASNDKQAPFSIREPEPPVSQVAGLTSLCELDHELNRRVGSFCEENEDEDLRLPGEIWTEFEVRGLDGSILVINRLKDDQEIRDIVFKYL